MVTLEFQDHVVREGTKVTWEREALRVIWDLQVQKEILVKEEKWDRKVNLVRKAQREIKVTRATKESKV